MGKIFQLRYWDSQSVKIYDQIVTPIISRIEKIIPPPIGQSLLSIGVKVNNLFRFSVKRPISTQCSNGTENPVKAFSIQMTSRRKPRL